MRRFSRRALVVVIVVLSVALAASWLGYPYWDAYKNVRVITVGRGIVDPRTLSPYGPLVIRSEEDLQKVLDGLKTSMKPLLDPREDEEYWFSRCREFEKAVRAGPLDFATESLILIPHKEGSCTVEVGLWPPYLESRRLVCNIWRTAPKVREMAMAYHCFAIAVKKDAVHRVEVRVAGRTSTVSIGGEQ